MQDFTSVPPQTHKEQNGIIMVESAPLAEVAVATGKKKNKKKKAKQEENVQKQQQSQPDRMVTLKNPMFFNNPPEPMNSMMQNLQTPPFVSPMAAGEPQSASIIRNENGMYTIRNPSFQNAFGGAAPTAAAPGFTPRPPMDPIARPTQFQSFEEAQPKCSSVIGSEMKNARRYRTEQEFAANNMQFGMRQPTGYSHFGPSMNFNHNGTHCDESFGSGSGSGSGFPSYYDDLRLQPGQMLNSEVSLRILGNVELAVTSSSQTGHDPQRHGVENVSKSGQEDSATYWNATEWQREC